ncbi:MAG: IgA Peptidase M64 [Woeseiaceae bacterium]|nr:IgA Peptidase M64 [Woeseiaceae bacterium]
MKTAVVVLFAICCTVTAYAGETVQTMRLDYYHSGNAESETFSIDELVLEPLPFPGNLAQPTDKTLRGKYAFEILDKESGALLWSRSFSSIYGEWETTAEAQLIDRTFHESLRFPAPQSEFRVVIRKRGADNGFVTVWETGLDPGDYLVHRESAPYRDDVTAIEYNGDPREKVDLLLLGDGYTADEIGTFLDRAKELTEVFLSTSPFREHRSDFNVWALAPPARESGVSRPSTGTYRDSPIGATYDAFRSERYVLTYENKAWRQIASSVPYDFVEILTNSDTYGGGGIYGLYSTAAAHSEWAAYLFVHEFGHHFAGLADEYYTSSVAYEAPESITEPYEPNVTALLDPARLKWKQHTESATPIPTPWPKEAYEEHSLAYQARRAQMRAENVAESEMNQLFHEDQQFSDGLFSTAPYRDAVGAFEGANYQSKGYYRSEMNCIMFTRSSDFCRVCSDAIEQVIDEYTRPAE